MKGSEISVAKRYAKALFFIASQKEALTKYQSEVLVAKSSLYQTTAKKGESDVSFFQILKDPKINKPAKIKLLKEFLDKLNLSKPVINCFLLMVKKSRIAIIGEFARQFDNMCLKKMGRKKAKIITAAKLDEALVGHLLDNLQKQKNITYEVENVVDPGILGGFIFREENFYYDLSIRGSLEDLRKQIIDS